MYICQTLAPFLVVSISNKLYPSCYIPTGARNRFLPTSFTYK